jgi:ABC-type glycerol-3-phosphate transport system permease component
MLKTLGWSAQRRFNRWGRGLLIGLAVVVFTLPPAWTFAASLNILPDDNASPPAWTWPPSVENYLEIGVAEPGFVQELTTSISVSVTSTLLTIIVSFLAAYSLACSPFRGSQLWAQGFLVLASLPVMAYIIPLSDCSLA